MSGVPENYEAIQLKHCSDSRNSHNISPGRSGRRLIKNVAEAQPYFKKYGKSLPILDVGCGDAWGLQCWRDNFQYPTKDLYGIEYTQERVTTAHSFGFNNVIKGAMEDVVSLVQQFGVMSKFNVFCTHTLEHAYDQERAVKEIQKIAHIFWVIVPVELKKTKNKAHFHPIYDLESIKQYFDEAEWKLMREQRRKNLESEGLLVYLRNKVT